MGAHGLRIQGGLCGLYLGGGGFLSRQVLVDLLGAERTGVLQRAGTLGIAFGVQRVGFGFHQRRFGLRHVGLDGIACKSGQQLPFFHRITHVDQHLRQPQATGFRAHTGFLPSGDIAVGGDVDGQAGDDGLGGAYCQRRFGGRRAVVSLCRGAGR